MLEKRNQNMKTHQKSDSKMDPKSIKNHSKNRCEKREKKEGPPPLVARCAVSPNPIISKDIVLTLTHTKKVEWGGSAEWSAKSEVQRESEKRQVQKASAERQVQTRNTHRTQTRSVVATTCGYIQVPAAKFRTWSLRMIFEG